MTSAKILSIPDLKRMLDRVPQNYKDEKQEHERLCPAMSLLVLGERAPDPAEQAMVEEKIGDMTRLMHQCMHIGPRVSALAALNCLVSLEILFKEVIPDREQRMGVHSALLAKAMTIVAHNELSPESLVSTKH